MKAHQPYRLIISGGGTGGHIFPAISIANKFKERHPDADILFVGAKGKMEMVRVPEAGYKIIGLWISGLQRKITLSNLLFPFKLLSSYWKAGSIIKKFKPHVVIGTGGYASGPIMLAAARHRIPSLIQEQNSYAGLTNKRLAGKAHRVCVAYAGMEKYFPKEKIIITGNPVRKDLLSIDSKKERAQAHFSFCTGEKTLLILGGSLGARTINESVIGHIDKLIDARVHVIWQTGKLYYEHVKTQLNGRDLHNIRIYDFIQIMDMAYAAADVVISRAGALAISELCLAKKPSILVPSPNVAEDHQTKNAMSLVKQSAAVLVRDNEAKDTLVKEALHLLFDVKQCEALSQNIAGLAKPNATEEIVTEIEKILTNP
ncbi:MAG: undecaprenyldiphospho-muramoylpentapeptide beta-N-acetylglucosaminyltransferase [Bacteroidetes bacterium]|nr:undecaprenyldiphospho-muramoylpentapeptide beta-N-acetylglucosaminyltransferase [Bacteroidota bacterium]